MDTCPRELLLFCDLQPRNASRSHHGSVVFEARPRPPLYHRSHPAPGGARCRDRPEVIGFARRWQATVQRALLRAPDPGAAARGLEQVYDGGVDLELTAGQIHQAWSISGTLAIIWPTPWPDRWFVGLLGCPPPATEEAGASDQVVGVLEGWGFQPSTAWAHGPEPLRRENPTLEMVRRTPPGPVRRRGERQRPIRNCDQVVTRIDFRLAPV